VILDSTDLKIMPIPLIIFLGSLTSHKAFIPDNFLTIFELNRLQTDPYGALLNPDDEQVKMILGFYIIGKILIGKILLKPESLGLNIQMSSKVLGNFKILASLIYLNFLEYI
jgi:hypothetical protein